jgi:hypothetical protein
MYARSMADTYTVERSIEINATAESVYARIVDFHKWKPWSPWEDLDPDLEQTYSGSASGTGAVYAWSGNRKAGEGRMEMTDAAKPASVEIALDFLKPFKSSSVTTFELTDHGDTTGLVWTLTGSNTLMLKVMGIFRSMDQMIGPDFEKGLASLKAVSEQPTN